MSDQHQELLQKIIDFRKLVDEATMGPWRALESKDHWSLHGEARQFKTDPKSKNIIAPSMQILKAPKHSTPYAEYWPNAADSALIVEAANSFSFWLDWAEDVLKRHYPLPCACNKNHHLLCAADRVYSWEECAEVKAVVRAVERLHG